ncbi:MAG: glycosyltransferase family 4 protein [Acetobacteraceae bacterium]
MKKPVVAFFDSQLKGSPRGALRLFRAIAAELCTRDDIDIVVLGDPVSDDNDPLGCTFSVHDPSVWALQSGFIQHRHAPLDYLIQPMEQAAALAGGTQDSVMPRDRAPPAERSFWLTSVDHLRAAYRSAMPYHVRRALNPMARSILVTGAAGEKLARRAAGAVARRLHARPAEQVDVPVPAETETDATRGWVGVRPENAWMFTPGPVGEARFTNRDIVGSVITLDQVDVVLDFWWFHISSPSPMRGRFRPPNLRVVGWFLDAIPLRIPPWSQPQLTPSFFRRAVQEHLEMVDEVVTISNRAAQDIGLFFPHLHKPIHVVPCGIYPEDFARPAVAPVLDPALGIDPDLPLFVFIGALEPYKNLTNCLKALSLVAVREDRPVQAVIIGAITSHDLEPVMGPALEPVLQRMRVVITGMVSEAKKRAILSHATALVYASLWEGFGIPPLEAMAAGVPVVVGDTPTLRENCADLAEYCDPYDVHDIAAAIRRTLHRSPDELRGWRQRAQDHAARYTWPAAADRLVSDVFPPMRSPADPKARPEPVLAPDTKGHTSAVAGATLDSAGRPYPTPAYRGST